MSKETGGTAFPLPLGGETVEGQEGMTLRDYFAAKAMQGILACPRGYEGDRDTNQGRAYLAYDIADAMIAARGQ